MNARSLGEPGWRRGVQQLGYELGLMERPLWVVLVNSAPPTSAVELADVLPPRTEHWRFVLPRLTPIKDKSEVAPEYHHVVDGVLEVFGSIRGPHSILLHDPASNTILGTNT